MFSQSKEMAVASPHDVIRDAADAGDAKPSAQGARPRAQDAGPRAQDARLRDVIAEQERIFLRRQPGSAAMAARARGSLVGGVTSSWQISVPQPVWLSHGRGSKVYD